MKKTSEIIVNLIIFFLDDSRRSQRSRSRAFRFEKVQRMWKTTSERRSLERFREEFSMMSRIEKGEARNRQLKVREILLISASLRLHFSFHDDDFHSGPLKRLLTFFRDVRFGRHFWAIKAFKKTLFVRLHHRLLSFEPGRKEMRELIKYLTSLHRPLLSTRWDKIARAVNANELILSSSFSLSRCVPLPCSTWIFYQEPDKRRKNKSSRYQSALRDDDEGENSIFYQLLFRLNFFLFHRSARTT